MKKLISLALYICMANSSIQQVSAQNVKSVQQPALNVIEWRAASTMLDRARQLIELRGWQQGAISKVLPECAATALEHAFFENTRRYSVVDFNYAREALSRTIDVAREPVRIDDDLLAVPYWGRNLMDWNDKPGRTKSEVLKAFKNASNLALKLSKEAEKRNAR
jgi:hypothetical protein